ncbi:hypothetical protein CON03_08560 [Bacillus cereus]|nr:hypothetical protein CON03_08560 [Bacillus cereus]PFE42469.1 hypothetical protein CN317_23900 [Bacillus cereus]
MNSKVFITNYEAKTLDLIGKVQKSQFSLELTFWSKEECVSAQASFLKDFNDFLKSRNDKADF